MTATATVITLSANELANAAALHGDGIPIVWRDDTGVLRLGPGVVVQRGGFTPKLVRSCAKPSPWIGPHPDTHLGIRRNVEALYVVPVDRIASVTARRIAGAVADMLADAGIVLTPDLVECVRSVAEVQIAPIPDGGPA